MQALECHANGLTTPFLCAVLEKRDKIGINSFLAFIEHLKTTRALAGMEIEDRSEVIGREVRSAHWFCDDAVFG